MPKTKLYTDQKEQCIYLENALTYITFFPSTSVNKESACQAGGMGSIPGSGRSPREGNGNPLRYSCLENLTDRGASRATVHEVARVGHDLATKPTCNFPKISHIHNNHHCSRALGKYWKRSTIIFKN